MNKQEAINILYRIHAYAFEKDNNWLKEHADSLLKYLKQPTTLADFLGWEEDVEYKKGGNVCMVSGGELYIKYIDEDDWYKVGYSWNESNIEEFRNCKKVEKKETKEELLDELQKLVSSERINEIKTAMQNGYGESDYISFVIDKNAAMSDMLKVYEEYWED